MAGCGLTFATIVTGSALLAINFLFAGRVIELTGVASLPNPWLRRGVQFAAFIVPVLLTIAQWRCIDYLVDRFTPSR